MQARIPSIVFLMILCLLSTSLLAETINVVSHNSTLVVTDPSKGSNSYRSWATFPGKETEYRKVVLQITYRCPDGLHCGEWDYIDGVYLKRIGSATAHTQNLELARIISPYGWRFDSTWSFTWQVDITDFGNWLHDSVEVEFLHTGYENNADRGWVITLDFALTLGRPAMQVLGMDTLWFGSIPYGDSTKPVEAQLAPIKFANRLGADYARLRIVQTGHGMDDQENCAEFCSKFRRVIFDDSLWSERQIWRRCDLNPLYPQAGTWIFNRANWCPGATVYPDNYDFPLQPGGTHSIDIELEPYLNHSKPTANYFLSAYLFHLKAPWASNDVALEEILIPNDRDEYSRQNPACANAAIVMRNCGNDTLQTAQVAYGHGKPPAQLYEWKGALAPQQADTVDLPGPIALQGENKFVAVLSLQNGAPDEYPDDNEMVSVVPAAAEYGTSLILAVRTNANPWQNGYRVIDRSGKSILDRPMGSLAALTDYRDTLRLRPGCYQLVLSDSAGDGLEFWFNPEGGFGYARLLDLRGRLLKSFNSDFGGEINHWFTVAENATPPDVSAELPIVVPFPPRNEGSFDLHVFLGSTSELRVAITDEAGAKTVLDTAYAEVKEGILPIDIKAAPDGVYFVKVTVGEKTVSRRIRIKRDG